MFDPVWLGNSIVPRWEAIALVIGVPAACIVIAGIFAFGFYLGGVWIVRQLFKS